MKVVHVKAYTKKTKKGKTIRVRGYQRSSGKRYAVYAKIKGVPEGVLWKLDKSGKRVPIIFRSKKRAIERGEIWKRKMNKENLKAKYTIGSGTKEGKTWEMESLLDIWKRTYFTNFGGRKK